VHDQIHPQIVIEEIEDFLQLKFELPLVLHDVLEVPLHLFHNGTRDLFLGHVLGHIHQLVSTSKLLGMGLAY
jgi:hypothetical protein